MRVSPEIVLTNEERAELMKLLRSKLTSVRLAVRARIVLLVEQNVFHTLQIADRGYVLENGAIALTGTGAELLGNPHVRRAYLGH